MDCGGLPYWLLKNEDIVLRSSKDQRYLDAVDNWLTFLLVTKVQPYLYKNGGPIVSVQVENEYGSYKECDKKYMQWMRDLARKHLGNDTVLITTDGWSIDYLKCGRVDGVLPTIDFGAATKKEVVERFDILRKLFLPKGPMVNSEFYPGWLDKWGNAKHATTPTQDVLNTMEYMWSLNVTSFTIYPAHGGSNWGYQAGSLEGPPFQGVTTGYDFDAPISESGGITPKFIAMRKQIEKLTGKKIEEPIPETPPKYAYGRFRMEWMGTILDLKHAMTDPNRIVQSEYPLSMEDLDLAYGFVLYETLIPKSASRLQLKNIRDRAYVIINNQLVTVLQRGANETKRSIMQISKYQKIDTSIDQSEFSRLSILVENQGRICYGPLINDRKGLIDNVTLDDQVLTNWTNYPLDLQRVYKSIDRSIDSGIDLTKLIPDRSQSTPRDRSGKYLPSIYYGYFFADPKPGDTYFDPSDWGKGQLFVNGRNIGRYWPQAGPQITLYVPGVYLTQWQNFNQIYLFEMDRPGRCENDEKFGCYAEFSDQQKFIK